MYRMSEEEENPPLMYIIGTINQYSNNSDNSNIVVGKSPGSSACTLIATIAAHTILTILDKEERTINLDSRIVDECIINGIKEYSKNNFSEHLDTVDVFSKIKSFQLAFHRLEDNDFGDFGNLENNPAGFPIQFECNNNLSDIIDQIIAKRTYNDKYTAVVITMRGESWCLFIPPIESKPYFFFNSHPHRELNLQNAFIALGTKTHICDFYKEVYPESNSYPDGNGGGNGTGYILQLQMSYSDKSGGGSRRKRRQKRKSAKKRKSKRRNTRARRTTLR